MKSIEKMSSITEISEFSTQYPDLKVSVGDGEVSLHSLLLVVHSKFLREIFNTLPINCDPLLILPDSSVEELKTLTSIMYGLNKSGLVSESILKALGLFDFDQARIEYHDGLMIILNGPLQGFRLIDPTKKFYIPIPTKKSQNPITKSVPVSSAPEEQVSCSVELLSLSPTPPQLSPPMHQSSPSDSQSSSPALQSLPPILQLLPQSPIFASPLQLSPPIIGNVVDVVTTPMEPTFSFTPPLAVRSFDQVNASPELQSLLEPETLPGNSESDVVVEIVCRLCHKKFKAKRYLKAHMLLKHSKDPSYMIQAKENARAKSYNHQCTICEQYFHSRNIVKHVETMHPEIQYMTCEHCGKTFKKMWFLQRHVENVHNKSRTFNCEHCVFIAKRKQHLEDHMRIHMGQFYSCDNCDFQTLRHREFKEHKCKGKTKGFSCQFCEKKCASEAALKKHNQVPFCNIHKKIHIIDPFNLLI